MPDNPPDPERRNAPRRELFAWAMYDFANSGYTTVVLTTIYNTFFVAIVAAPTTGTGNGLGTFLWTLALAISNGLVLLSAPVLGSVADHRASKKAFLLFTTVGCVIFTGLLAFTGPGDIAIAMTLLVLSNVMFATGENLIAAFLPEISRQEDLGRISGYGWALGYFGGLLVLLLCLAYIMWAKSLGHGEEQFVPVTMVIVATAFALAASPTLIILRERATPYPLAPGENYLHAGFARVRRTLSRVHTLRDMFRFMIALTVYTCGIYTVIVLAAVYAREVFGFGTVEVIVMITVVNITAAIGAFIFGHIQDRLGSIPTLVITLLGWITAILLVHFTDSPITFWIAANLIGLALGSCQSAGRALIGRFAPPGRSAEFYGLWGLAAKLAAIIGPISYGLISVLSGGDHRSAILSTLAFFIGGLVLLLFVDEKRGHRAALEAY